MKPSETNESPQPDKRPQIGPRRSSTATRRPAPSPTSARRPRSCATWPDDRLDSLAEALFRAETLEGPEAYAAAGLQATATNGGTVVMKPLVGH